MTIVALRIFASILWGILSRKSVIWPVIYGSGFKTSILTPTMEHPITGRVDVLDDVLRMRTTLHMTQMQTHTEYSEEEDGVP